MRLRHSKFEVRNSHEAKIERKNDRTTLKTDNSRVGTWSDINNQLTSNVLILSVKPLRSQVSANNEIVIGPFGSRLQQKLLCPVQLGRNNLCLNITTTTSSTPSPSSLQTSPLSQFQHSLPFTSLISSLTLQTTSSFPFYTA